ncbi:hypothetical protein P5673_018959 [Acropora cervicornis]|uniref:Uncharacterized protein n=1 Tax=Acropora cervicornis TaxID=6130 RepID=A0AAD9QCL4_ACRCE|nr:hypothetical protein P5673_018959 [Acropora cervicornis]
MACAECFVIPDDAVDRRKLGLHFLLEQNSFIYIFNFQNPNGIKRDLSQLQGCWKRLTLQSKKEHDLHCREERKTGGGKAPASPSDASKEVVNVLPACVNPLKQEFDDDAGEELDLRRDKDEREVIKCEL